MVDVTYVCSIPLLSTYHYHDVNIIFIDDFLEVCRVA